MFLKKLKEFYRYRKFRKSLIVLGPGCELDGSLRITFPNRTRFGEHIYVGPGCYFNAQGGLDIGDHSVIAPEVLILTSIHRYKDATKLPYDEVDVLRPVHIGRCAWLGMRAVIMPGVILGEGCIVGAAAVVTKSYEAGTILAGNPAKPIGQRDMARYQDLTERKQFYLKLKREQGLLKKELADQNRSPHQAQHLESMNV